MSRIIPGFIIDQFKKKNLSGSFKGYTMFIDITGFTSLTEELMKHGKEGVEVLSEIINSIYEPVIEEIYKRTGFVSTFAGDAFHSIFTDAGSILRTSKKVSAIFKKLRFQKTKFGNFHLDATIGLSYGKINWGILGEQNNLTYYFSGPAIKRAITAEEIGKGSDIILDRFILKKFNRNLLFIEKTKKDYYKLLKFKSILDPSHWIKKHSITRAVLSKFILAKIPTYPSLGEFRNIVSVFVDFKTRDNYNSLQDFFTKIMTNIKQYGGYLNNIEFSPQKNSFSVFFGAPITYENILSRAVNFSFWLRRKFKTKIKVGLTYGTVYSGYIGSKLRLTYTCIGDIVNLASRIVTKAKFGSIHVDNIISTRLQGQFTLKKLGAFRYKGKRARVNTYRLLARIERARKVKTRDLFLGRDSEQKKIIHFLTPIFQGKFSGVLSVFGNPGIGKSSLIHYTLGKKLKNKKFEVCLMQTDPIFKSSLNPVIYFLNDFFNQEEGLSPDKRISKFNRVFRELNREPKLIRSESKTIYKSIQSKKELIGNFLGLKYKRSKFANFEPQLRDELTRIAIRDLFKFLSLKNPLIIFIEDIHWIDSDSMEFLEDLTKNLQGFPIAIITTGRYLDDGSKPKLRFSKATSVTELDLEQFSKKSAKEFIEKLFSNKVQSDLFEYLYTKTGGNPFYLEQFCFYLLENNLLTLTKSKFYSLNVQTDEIPLDIHNIIISRIDRLSSDIKDLLQVASVFGREFELNILSDTLKYLTNSIKKKVDVNLNSKQLRKILKKGVNENLWYAITDLKYIFQHSLLRDTAYAMQLKSRLRLLHEVAGKSLEKFFKRDITRIYDIAYHYYKAEKFSKAFRFFSSASKFSERTYKINQFLECNIRMLEILKNKATTDPSKIAETHCSLSSGYMNKLMLPDMQEHFDIAYNIWSKHPRKNRDNIANLYSILGNFHYVKGDFKQAERYFKKMDKLLKNSRNNSLISLAYYSLGNCNYYLGNLNKAKNYYEKGLKVKVRKRSGERYIIPNLLMSLGIIANDDGRLKEANHLINKAHKLFLKYYGREHPDTALSLVALGNIHSKYQKFEKAMEYYKESLEIRLRIYGENNYTVAESYWGVAYSYQNMNKLDEAMKYFQKSLEITNIAVGKDSSRIILILIYMTNIELSRKNFKETMKINKYAEKLTKRHFGNDHQYLIYIFDNYARIYLELGKFKMAMKYAKSSYKIGIKIFGEQSNHCAEYLKLTGVIYAKMKKNKLAKKNLKKALELYRYLNLPDDEKEILKFLEELNI